MTDDCPCSKVPGITSIVVRGNTVGLIGLSALIAQWSAENRFPANIEDWEIVEALRSRNYVSDQACHDYAAAVRILYAKTVASSGEASIRR